MFNLEILTHEQISRVKSHLSEFHSPKALILHYHNLLDFRFVQGSIVTTHNSIIYTIKIPILNPIEFSLFQRLSIINQYKRQITTNNINDNLGEFKQPEIQPLIIENYLRSFEPLKTLAVPTIATPEFKKFGVEFHTSITSLTIVLLLLFIGIIYLICKHKNKNIQNTQTTPKDDEDVLQIGR